MAEWSDRHEYTAENVARFAPETGGVYRLIYHRPSDAKYFVFYVGQSENLEQRLHGHLSPSEPDECIKRHLWNYTCYFRYIGIASESERDRVERSQIEEYNPSCND